MEKFYLEVPTIERKQGALEYLQEHIENGADLNGTGGLKSIFGDDWKHQFDEIKKKRQKLQQRRDALRHVHYDQIVKLQEWRERDGEQSNKFFTIIDTNTDLDDLIEKQHVRANKPIGVKMPVLIDNDFFDAV